MLSDSCDKAVFQVRISKKIDIILVFESNSLHVINLISQILSIHLKEVKRIL